jgi:hypothetical protein
MNKTLVAALATGVSVLASSSAIAGQPMAQLCQTLPCVYDHNNKLIGIPWPDRGITRQIKGEWYQYNSLFANDGPTANGLFYYTLPNCAGQPYMQDGEYMPKQMLYDGSSFFAPVGDPQSMTSASYSYPAKPQRGGYCVNQTCIPSHNSNSCDITAAPAVKLETITFYPPLKMQ